MGVDSTDIRILEHLQEDGRASLRKLARELNLSPSTVSNRFRKLKDEGVIRGFVPLIDFEKVGLNLTAVIEIRADAKRTEEVSEDVRDLEKVVSFFETTGDTDMVVVCKFLDRSDMNAFVKRLQKIDGVMSTETNVVLTSPKIYERKSLHSLLEEVK